MKRVIIELTELKMTRVNLKIIKIKIILYLEFRGSNQVLHPLMIHFEEAL